MLTKILTRAGVSASRDRLDASCNGEQRLAERTNRILEPGDPLSVAELLSFSGRETRGRRSAR
jgi:hypothetical protein